MSSSEEKKARAALREVVDAALRAPMPKWRAAYGVDGENLAAPGTILRVPDALLRAHGLEAPASVVVVRADAHGVLAVPIRITDEARQGEIPLRGDESPFLRGFCLVAWLPLRMPAAVLGRLQPLARAPAVADVAVAIDPYSVPRGERETWSAWNALIRALSST